MKKFKLEESKKFHKRKCVYFSPNVRRKGFVNPLFIFFELTLRCLNDQKDKLEIPGEKSVYIETAKIYFG